MTAVRTGLGPVGGRHSESACYLGHRTRSVRATIRRQESPPTIESQPRVRATGLGPGLTLALSQRKVGPRLGGSAQRTSLRRHRDEALQERGRGDYEQTDARSRARWHGGLVFFLSRSCDSVYIGIELVQDFFLATPGLVGSGVVGSG
jgi:hypothetical protein